MRSVWRSSVLCAGGLSVWWAVTATSQTAGSHALSGALRDHLKTERLDVVTSIRGLPLGVREKLQELFGGQLDIAESNAESPGPDAAFTADRPFRRLIAAGCSIDHCLVHYERRGSDRTWPLVLFHWTPAETRVEWSGHARARLASLDEVRNAVLAGTLKDPVTSW